MHKITTKTKHEQIKELLKKELLSGKYLPEARFYSQNKLAEYFGISPLTAREAISTLVHEGLLVRSQGKGTFVANYSQSANSGNIGLVIHHSELFALSFFTQVNQGSNAALKDTGYHSLLIPFDEKTLKDKKNNFLLSLAQEKKIAGFLITASQVNEEELFNLQKQEIPFILVHCFYPEKDFSFVCPDFFKASYLLTEHLIKLGHQKILYLGGYGERYPAEKKRLDGYKKALKDAGLKYNPQLRIDLPFEYLTKENQLLLNELKKLKEISFPEAIYCGDDLMAYKVIKHLRKKGYQVPEDIAVVGTGNFKFSGDFQPPVTTVEYFRINMAKRATEILLNKISNKDSSTPKIFIEPKLIIRESCGYKM